MKDKVRLFDMAMKMEESGNMLAALELGKRCLALGVDKKFKAAYKHPKTGIFPFAASFISCYIETNTTGESVECSRVDLVVFLLSWLIRLGNASCLVRKVS